MRLSASFRRDCKKNFAKLKNSATFVVQHRGIEQLVARRAHNPEAGGSSPPPATTEEKSKDFSSFFVFSFLKLSEILIPMN